MGAERVVALSPQGRQLDQELVEELAAEPALTLLSARFEGFDERVLEHLATDSISIGPYVLSGGELPAMVVLDAVARRLPGALGSEESVLLETFSEELDRGFEYPHYTRPADYRGWRVPDVLLSGDHARVEAWRRRAERRAEPALRGPIDRLTARLPKPWRTVVDWALTIGIAVVAVLLIKAYVVNPYRIPSSSMEPTLHCAQPGPGCEAGRNDRVIANRFIFHFRDPERGEIIVFNPPPRRRSRRMRRGGTYVKRLIGLPGDTISQENGVVFVDGTRLEEPYIKPPAPRRPRLRATGPRRGRVLHDGRQPQHVLRQPGLGADLPRRHDRPGLLRLLAARPHRVPLAFSLGLRAPSPMSNLIDQIERRQLREVPHFKAGDTVRVHFQVIEGQRRRIQIFEGICIKRQGAGRPRDVHGSQALLRRRRRAHVPPPFAEDREDRGRGDRRREPRQALLPSREGGKEGARPREAAALGEYPRPGGDPWAAERKKLIAFDRRLGVRLVAGADEAGRGSLAGPLVAAAVLLDYDELRGRRTVALSQLNDSKQLSADERESPPPRGARCRDACRRRDRLPG